jgi:ketosteroid isomerase-like protein
MQPSTRTAISDEILAAMKRTNEIASQAIAGGTLEEFELVYTENARILPPGAPMISGRAAIIDFWRGIVASGLTRATLTTIDTLPAGDSVVEIGRADLTVTGKNVAVKYVVYWRQEEGAWKWHVDLWNAND